MSIPSLNKEEGDSSTVNIKPVDLYDVFLQYIIFSPKIEKIIIINTEYTWNKHIHRL